MIKDQRAGPQCPKCKNVDNIKTRTLEDAVIVNCEACGHIIGCVGPKRIFTKEDPLMD